jgi:two-component system, NtrC family, response regulator AtoC
MQVAKVLVVDDDDNMRALIRTILERRGHEVRVARDGMEGLATYEKDRQDLVVTDIVMPGIGGLAFFAELQRRPSPPKVLIVSGKQLRLDGEMSALQAQGRLAFMRKPFTPVDLAASVQALIG